VNKDEYIFHFHSDINVSGDYLCFSVSTKQHKLLFGNGEHDVLGTTGELK